MVKSNKVEFRSSTNIGENGAENDDEFLFRCFVDHEALAIVQDMNNSKMFLLGSTGIGKTAILRMIEKNQSHCRSIEVHDMAMDHITNSDTIQFMRSIGLDLTLFFNYLWKHILTIEIVKLVSNTESSDRYRYAIDKIRNFLGFDHSRERFDKFVEENENRFWNTIDANLIEITDGFTSKVHAELGGEIEKSSARAGYARQLSSEKKTQLQQRARRYIDPKALAELSHVIADLAEYVNNRPDDNYILIDKLDEHWVDPSIKSHLLQSLFESLKGLRKFRRVKFIVALRNDVYEKMISESTWSKAQVEKNEDFICRIKWTREELWELASKRIDRLFQWKYTKENVYFQDVFPERVGRNERTWSYLVGRTLNRPRDVINYINFAMQAAEGKSSISRNDFNRATRSYSERRRQTLIYEWEDVFPAISVAVELIEGKPEFFGVSEFCTSDLHDRLFDRVGATEEFRKDGIWREIEKSVSGKEIGDPIDLAREVFFRLHLIGAVGLKLEVDRTWHWSYLSETPIQKTSINLDTKVKIHPMLHASLNNLESDNSRGYGERSE